MAQPARHRERAGKLDRPAIQRSFSAQSRCSDHRLRPTLPIWKMSNKTLKWLLGRTLRILAPRVYWRRRLVRLRHDFSEQELAIAPLLCDKESTSVDIGADAGSYTANIIDNSRECIAFEPRATQSAMLKEMFRCLSLPVRVETVALSDKRGEVKMRILEKDAGRSTIESEDPWKIRMEALCPKLWCPCGY